MGRLTDAAIKAARRKGKPYKLRDGAGLHLLVMPSGSKLWRFRFGHGRTESMVSFGRYGAVTLAKARAKADAARQGLVDGVTPAQARRAERATRADTFQAVAFEWLSRQDAFADITRRKAEWLFGLVLPAIGARAIAELEAPEVLQALRKVESSGHLETAQRVKQRISQVCRYAVATGRARHDPTSALRGALKSPQVTNHAALTDPQRVGELLRSIDGYQGEPTTAAALKLLALVFVRSGELRGAEWREFSLDAEHREWRIPAARMKMGTEHLVPLSRQAVAVLRELHALTARGALVFPGLRSRERAMSDNTINAALRRLGYSSAEMTCHGFRTTASTLLNEQGWHPDLIELQLAHAERNKVRAAYNKAQRLPERRKMMQAWADYLDGLKSSGNVVALKHPA